MAIRAQYPSHALLLHRGEERTGIDLSQGLPGFLDPSFSEGGGDVNPRKRGRGEVGALPMETGTTPVQHNNNCVGNLLSLQPNSPPPTFISLAQLQSKSTAPLVSTGHRGLNPLLPSSPSLFEEIEPHLKQHQEEIDGYLRAQGELLRRTLAGKWRSHYRTLLSAAAAAARQRIRAKEAEAEQAAMQHAELEERLARLRTESLTWQAKAAVAQSAAAALQAQLQRATAAASSDAGSAAFVDPGTAARGSCRACRRRDAAVVVLPCRHLSLCADCAAAGAAEFCPGCGRVSSGSVHVAFS